MKIASLLFFAAAAAGTFAFTRPAAALGPLDIEVGARAGYGSSPYKNYPFDALKAGAGARAGVTVFNVYAGASLMYYFGDGNGSFSATSLMYGIEGGYNFNFLFLTIRPQIGIGNFETHYTWATDMGPMKGPLAIAAWGGVSNRSLYIEPRATALVHIAFVYLGADAGVLLTPGLYDSKAAVLVNGQLGVKF
ncbi:MAG: hypothetical protein FWD17_15640 [Polyangiaceae bacterium]|nr:hypothetical protein [Polyangiaceae bacterium]